MHREYIYQMPSLQQIQSAVRHIRLETGGNIDTLAQLRKYLQENMVRYY